MKAFAFLITLVVVNSVTSLDCSIGGSMLPHERDCDKFYMCANGFPFPFNCPLGLEFNPSLQVCDWADQSGCLTKNIPTDAPEPETTLAPTEVPTTPVETEAPTTPEQTEAPTTLAPTTESSGEETSEDPIENKKCNGRPQGQVMKACKDEGGEFVKSTCECILPQTTVSTTQKTKKPK